ncbi:MAG: hypothetical protein FWD58_01870 [Firmicutes bacterium]|nr:hypothetical protein [Bacillota bacterium]
MKNMKNKSLYRTIVGTILFVLALIGLVACEKSEPGLSQGKSSPLELPWLSPLFYDARFIFALILGVALVALTVVVAVRIIREKRADKQADRAIQDEKWENANDGDNEKTGDE